MTVTPAHISTCSADKVIRNVDCSGTKGLAIMDDDVEQPEVGGLSRVFETAITMYGDPGEIQHAVGLLGFDQISSFSCRPLATREARLVFRVTDTTPIEAKRVIQGFTLAIEHVLGASRAPTTVDLTDPSRNERPCPCGSGSHLSACLDYQDEPA